MLASFQECSRRSKSRTIYLNVVVNRIKKLRAEVAESLKNPAPSSSSSGSSSTSAHPITKANLLTTHMQVCNVPEMILACSVQNTPVLLGPGRQGRFHRYLEHRATQSWQQQPRQRRDQSRCVLRHPTEVSHDQRGAGGELLPSARSSRKGKQSGTLSTCMCICLTGMLPFRVRP